MEFRQRNAFTLVELLVVISIIIVLTGIAFPAFQGVQNAAKKTHAKNDLVQIVTAVNAYYTEYGRYPIPTTTTSDITFGPGGSPTTNETLMNALRGLDASLNPRQIIFLSPPDAKDASAPKSGVGTTTGAGQFFDPWNNNYLVRIDGDYNSQVANPYSSNAGSASLQNGVIGWSVGKDKTGGSGDRNATTNKDDVISWQ
ncbi:MAG: type II secretion system protein [Chthoniobacterales bacterium]